MSLTRRDLFKGAGIAAASVAAAGALGGCAQKASASDDWMPSTWDYETDVLVIGYGGAGLWAAVTAKDEGEADVLVLEKAPSRGGGNSSINMGEYTWVDDIDGAVQYITGFSKGHTPEDIARAWAEECYQNMDYCDYWNIDTELKKGTNASGGTSSCEYPWIEGAEAMHVCSFGDPTKGGNAGWHTLDQARSDLGIEVVFNCHDEELIQNPETNEIVGCYTLIGDDAEKKAVKASKGVILATGGIHEDTEMTDYYCDENIKRVQRCEHGPAGFSTGDGHKMGLWVGAHMQDGPFPLMLHPQACSMFHGCFPFVNQEGHRFMNEGTWVQGKSMNVMHQTGNVAWSIFDADYGKYNRMSLENGTGGGMFWDSFRAVGTTAADASASHAKTVKEGVEKTPDNYKVADTIDELLKQLDVDVDEAKKTIERYNEICKKGEDTDFYKESHFLFPIEQGPFYATKVAPGLLAVVGGISISDNFEVVNAEGEPIKGLYAIGNCSGDMYAYDYPINVQGNSHGRCLVEGKCLGEQLAGVYEEQ